MFSNTNRRWELPTAVLLSVLVGAAAGYHAYRPIQNWRAQRYLQQERIHFLGKEVPSVATQSLAGATWRLSDHAGKVVLVEFWQDRCSVCVEEIPFLQEVYEEYGGRDDFEMVGVALDSDAATVVQSLGRFPRPWLQLHERGQGWETNFAKAFPVRGIPSVWLIDRNGKISDLRLRGFRIKEAVDAALSGTTG